MKVLFFAVVMLSLSGCAALQEPGEQAWLAAHAVDVAQTRTFRDDPCIEEGNWMTRGLIGREPTPSTVMAWGVGMAGIHLAVTQALLETDHPKMARVWEWVSFTEKGIQIAHNYSLGARFGGGDPTRCVR